MTLLLGLDSGTDVGRPLVGCHFIALNISIGFNPNNISRSALGDLFIAGRRPLGLLLVSMERPALFQSKLVAGVPAEGGRVMLFTFAYAVGAQLHECSCCH